MFAVLALSLLLSGDDSIRIDKTKYADRPACERVRVLMDKHPLAPEEWKRFTMCVPVDP